MNKNKIWWENKVKSNSVFTKPWLDLDLNTLNKYIDGILTNPVWPINDVYPSLVIEDVKGKSVLCLASGGGQQSAVFGLLGANVTVVDISNGQLKNDKLAANHYGYKVKTVQGDMSDLSMLESEFFDIVYQAPSMGYVSSIRKVYNGVARVLKQDGLYRADAQNPQSRFTSKSSWNGEGYLISIPYSVTKKKRAKDKDVIEFRHKLDDTFNGLIEAGFKILSVHEMPRSVYQKGKAKPGTWEHYLLYLPGIYTILVKKMLTIS